MLVIDASVVLKWFRNEPGSEAALQLLGENAPMLAPAIILLECHNTMAKLVLRKEAVFDQLAAMLPELKSLLSIEAVDDDLAEQASQISLTPFPRSGVAQADVRPFNIYDCTYVALAQRWSAELVTADAPQADVARANGCKVMAVR